jgi:hypothetical protein
MKPRILNGKIGSIEINRNNIISIVNEKFTINIIENNSLLF